MARLNVGIIGCGNIAKTMAWTVRKTRGFRPYAVASRSYDKAVGFAKQAGFKKAYGSYEELVNDPKVDLVYIATPHSEHYANAVLCIEHGKPCLVEKAFTANEKQARELFQLADEKHVFITEAMWTRYMPFVGTMKDVLASGVIGEPVLLEANLGYPSKRVKRMTDPELAGGSLLDLGVYPLNFAVMMFGDDFLRMEETCTYTTKHLDEQESISLIYRNGRMAVLSATMLGVTSRRGMIAGTKGYLEIDNINNFEKMTVYDASYQKKAVYKRPRQITGYEYELQACARALEHGWTECPEMRHEETLKMMHLLDQIRGSFGIVYPFELPQEKPDPLEQLAGATIQDPELAAKAREAAEGALLAAKADETDRKGKSAEDIPTEQSEVSHASVSERLEKKPESDSAQPETLSVEEEPSGKAEEKVTVNAEEDLEGSFPRKEGPAAEGGEDQGESSAKTEDEVSANVVEDPGEAEAKENTEDSEKEEAEETSEPGEETAESD